MAEGYIQPGKLILRPIRYSTNGSHAHFVTSGTHDHTTLGLGLPLGVLLVDYTVNEYLWTHTSTLLLSQVAGDSQFQVAVGVNYVVELYRPVRGTAHYRSAIWGKLMSLVKIGARLARQDPGTRSSIVAKARVRLVTR